MIQKQKKTTEPDDSIQKLTEKFEKINETKTDRTIIVKHEMCCGCGCRDVNVQRTVPYDSPLKDGDRVDDLQDTDIVLSV